MSGNVQKKIILNLVFFLLVCSCFANEENLLLNRLKDTLESSKTTESYIPLYSTEFIKAQKLFELLLKGNFDQTSNHHEWDSLGYSITKLCMKSDEFLIIRPVQKTSQAQGIFIFRKDYTHSLLIQAPHRFHDLYTGDLALNLFVENSVQVSAWNTVHRDEIDFGKAKNSMFHALTLASIHSKPKMKILQLHGFGSKSKRDGSSVKADIILSNGTKRPTGSLSLLSNCFEASGSLNVAVYPIHVRQLGGTTNIASRAMSNKGFDNFIHFEMSKPLRLQAKEDKKIRYHIINCIFKFLR